MSRQTIQLHSSEYTVEKQGRPDKIGENNYYLNRNELAGFFKSDIAGNVLSDDEYFPDSDDEDFIDDSEIIECEEDSDNETIPEVVLPPKRKRLSRKRILYDSDDEDMTLSKKPKIAADADENSNSSNYVDLKKHLQDSIKNEEIVLEQLNIRIAKMREFYSFLEQSTDQK